MKTFSKEELEKRALKNAKALKELEQGVTLSGFSSERGACTLSLKSEE
jgi:hypothetical protein